MFVHGAGGQLQASEFNVQMTQVQSSGVGYWQTKYSKLQEQSMLSL